MSPPCHHHNHHSPSYDHYYYNDYQSLRSALMSLEESTTTSRSDESSSNPQRQHDDGRQRLPQHYRYHDTNQHDRTHQDHGKRQHYESCVTGNYTSCINTNGSRKRPRGASTAATTGGNKIVHGVSMTFLLMILVATSCPSFVTSLSGLVYTKSGYDNPSGSNPICWSSPSFHNKSLSHDHDEHDEDHDDDRDDHEDHVDDEVLDHQEDDGGDHSGSNSTTSSNTTTIDNISNATTDVPTGNFTNVIPSNATAAARAIDFAHEEGEHEDNSGHHDLRLNHDDELLQDFDGKVWESILFPNFVAGPVTMEAECPPSVRLHVDVPHEHVKGEVLRTDTVYHYHVELEFDMDELRSYYGLSQDAHVVSESGDPVFALQIKMCEVNGNFCTPFAEKHDHTEENHGKTEDGHDDHDDHGLDDHDDHDSHSVYEEDDHDSHGAQEGEHDHDHRRLYVRRNVNRRSRGAIPQKNELRRLQKHIPDVIKDDLLKDYLYESHDDEGSDGHAAHGAHEDDLAVDTAILESPIVLIPVLENQTLVHIDLDVPVDLHVPGVFLPLATLQLFLSNATIHGHLPGLDEVAAFKVDIANALHQRSLIYQAPAEIRKVTRLAAIASYILVFSCTVFGMWLLYMVYRYREEKIMVLSQGKFLAVFQAAGILATTCCVLFEPKTDKFCYLSGPLVVLPMHFMLAILFGRLRRIITVMSPIMELGNASVSSLPNAESDGLKGFRRHLSAGVKKRKNLRQEFSAWRSWRVIFLFTIPQIILQIVQEAVYPPHLTLVLNVDGSIGRYQCGDNISQWIQFGELLCVYLGLIALVVESQRSKNLPALFNEAASISQASVGTIFIATAGLMIVVFSRDPTSSPDVRYIMLVRLHLVFDFFCRSDGIPLMFTHLLAHYFL